ncbi:hypothetical protein XccvBFoX3_gp66 [Xanthomonas phage FoX3]|uniref:Uncharacterized protein n=1 Tax=Xanthomonas phage FoX3 TaxID=2723899 RepID=A0A858NQM1_9CAUD|nr:hypothetical protein KNU95_gp66 [Xanthomonas phage FoX3]QJB21966.1 hypothetical protein XccvBFoX3_gp66 [Xanthomonas phage FoX3]
MQIRQGHTPARCVAALRAVIAALSAAQHSNESLSGYMGAYYEVAEMLGIGARVRMPGTDEGSPKHVWETEMRPMLLSVLSVPREDHGLLEQHHRDSAELRRLCAERDQQRADKLEMAAEAARWAEEAGRLKALMHDAKSVPDGWALVPVEPTGEMSSAATDIEVGYPVWDGSKDSFTEGEAKAIWKAMLAATPDPHA